VRIALITDTYDPQVNGVTTVVHRIVRVHAGAGNQVGVVAPRYPGDDADWCESGSADVLRIPSLPFPAYPAIRLALPYRRRVTRFLDAIDPELVHVATAAELDAAIEVLSVLAADSLLIVLADHGGGGVRPHDHDEAHPMNDRIPLVFAGPRVARRRRLDGPVSLLDVPPTVLHWLGVPVPASYVERILADAFHPRARAAVIAA
jgi:hypothetical protein